MRKLLRVALVVIAAGWLWLADARGQNPAAGTVLVRVPEDARLYFNGTLTQTPGSVRRFNTPPLPVGQDFMYELRAEVTRQGRPISETKRVLVRAGQTTEVDFSNLDAAAATPAAIGAAPTPAASDAADSDDSGWPRKFSADGKTLTIYQPQLEKWEHNRLEARAAVAIETAASPQPTFGVIWLAARTQVDKEQRLVTLEDIQVTRVNFPSLPDKGQSYLPLLQKQVPQTGRTLSLERLEAGLAVTQAESQASKVPLRNDPPEIIVSTQPAILVLVDGPPALRQVAGSNLLRVINTRALILVDQANGKFYLHVLDHWVQAGAIDGPWSAVSNPPAALEAAKAAVAQQPQPADLLDDLSPELKAELEGGKPLTVYVRTTPAELIEIQGEPQLAPIDGTQLLWVKNSLDQVLFDTASQDYFVLISGRWFRSKSLTKGPWEYVANDQLPADFAKIPETHPKGDVLPSVAGTPQAQELRIANRIPQTATIKRSEAKLEVTYDGPPKFAPIAETNLQYAQNTLTPVIRTAEDRYYAVENGVWFTAATPTGPWTVADSVPPQIYQIPPSSPLYYVTNVYVYDSTPEAVNVGYTPGYYGTCVAPSGCVVYGTGYPYVPWIGNYWFGQPWTYGWGASFGWWGGGWGFGFGIGAGWPWWGPIGWHGWGPYRPWWRPGWERGWGNRYNNIHPTHINLNNFNAYNRWNDNVHAGRPAINRPSGTRPAVTPAAVSRPTTVTAPRTLNNVLAGQDGNVYRPAAGAWQQHTPQGWQLHNPAPEPQRQMWENQQRQLEREMQARREAEMRTNAFRAGGGFGGYHGAGFRGGGFRGGGRR
jgi:uncharacterized protein (TIGR03000 family)